MTQYLPLACYGKAPCWLEYLEINVVYPSSRSFKDWIRQGRMAAGEGSKDSDGSGRYEERVGRRFLAGLPGSAEIVAGVLGPSRDQAGRANVLSVFAHVPRRALGRHYELLPFALAPAWEMLEDVWNALYDAPSRSRFDELVKASRVPAPDPVADVRARYGGLLREPLGWCRSRTDGASLERLGAGFPNAVEQIRKLGPDGLRVDLPVAVDADEACFDVSFWIDLVNRQFRWKRFEPTVFLDRGDERADRRVLLVYGKLQPGDYLAVTGGESPGARVLRPAHPTEGAAPPDESTPPDGSTPADGPAPSDDPPSYEAVLARRFGG